MSNLPNGIVHTGTHGNWTGTRPGHLQEVTVDCFRIDWARLGRLEEWLLHVAVPPVRPGPMYRMSAVCGQCRSLADTALGVHRTDR